MNAPQYRKNIHWGIRFWDYTDVGLMVDDPDDLLNAIVFSLVCPEDWMQARQWKEAQKRVVQELFPYLGCSAKRAAEAIREWMNQE